MPLTARSLPIPRRRAGQDRRAYPVALSPACWGVSDVPGWGPQLEAERVLSEVASLQVTAIEAGPSGFLPDRSVEARPMLKRHGLKVVAGPAHAVLHHHDIRARELAHIDGQASWLSALGAQTLLLTLIPPRDDAAAGVELSSTGWAHLLSAIGSVEHVCTAHRLRLAVQPQFGSMMQGPADIERLLVGSEAGICVDLGQLMLAGADPVEVIELAAGRIRHVHLNDINRAIAEQVRDGMDYATAVGHDLFKPIGQGGAHVARVVEALRDANYRGWYGLESVVRLQSLDEDPLAAVRSSLEYVTSLLV
jgi:inosose dehydratase